MNGSSIIVKSASVTLQGNELLKDISFALQPNEHLAILGSSGSGKTTLAKVLAGQLFARGLVEIRYDEYSSLQKKVVLTEQRNQFKNLSNTNDFYYQQRYNSFDTQDAQTVMQALETNTNNEAVKLDHLLKQFGLDHRREATLVQLSCGEDKRIQLVKAILSQPQMLILDSPFIGLDVMARKFLHQTINELAIGGTKIILITDANQIPDCITHVVHLEDGLLKSFLPIAEFDCNDVLANPMHHCANIYALPISETDAHNESVVDMHNVTITYGDKTILHNINWQVKAGEKWLLRGHNGAGKSTLISLLNGDNPQAYKNEISLFGKRRGSGESIWDIKKKIGFVSPELHAFFDKQTSCFNAIASGFFDTIGLFKKVSEEQQQQVTQWIDFLRLSSVQHKAIATLSFGTQRLVLLARALIKNPPLLILDEPCQGLDEEQKDVFVNLVNDICEQFNKTLIYISHYDNEIPACIENIMELKKGEQKIYSIKKQLQATN